MALLHMDGVGGREEWGLRCGTEKCGVGVEIGHGRERQFDVVGADQEALGLCRRKERRGWKRCSRQPTTHETMELIRA